MSTVAMGGLAGMAGCLDRVPFVGDSPLEFASQPASVPNFVLEETDYEEVEREEVMIEETFETAGQQQDVHVTNWQTEYDKAIHFMGLSLRSLTQARAAVFTVLTTPQVRVLGRTFNPVGDMSSEELAEMVQDRFDEIEGLEQVDQHSAKIRGERTNVGEFEGEANLIATSQSIDLTLFISEAVESADDYVIAVGGFPTNFNDQEDLNIFALMENIEHPD